MNTGLFIRQSIATTRELRQDCSYRMPLPDNGHPVLRNDLQRVADEVQA